jgi:hypothetical protein
MFNPLKKILIVAFVFLGLVAALVSTAEANHSWGSYHWARTSNPFNLRLGDNVSTNWDSYLRAASADWSQSNVLNTTVVTGSTNPKNCRAVAGQVEVCNSKYGNNGWLGIATIWANGNHITQGTVKMNDTYFATAKYNTPAWRQFVICQEIGHTFGLDHQDEVFDNTNLGTCMDYTNNPSSNQHPNAHDYEMLEAIYSHLDSSSTLNQTSTGQNTNIPVDTDNPNTWGKAIRTSQDGNPSLFVRDLRNSEKVFTFVIWADK